MKTGAGVGEGWGGGSVFSGDVGGVVSVEPIEVDSAGGCWVGTASILPPATAVWVAIILSSASNVLMALSEASVTGGGVDAESLHPASIIAEVTNTIKKSARVVVIEFSSSEFQLLINPVSQLFFQFLLLILAQSRNCVKQIEAPPGYQVRKEKREKSFFEKEGFYSNLGVISSRPIRRATRSKRCVLVS